MANQEIHNYLDEQTTPNESDFLDIDADLGGGNWLSKKLSLFNIRKWLFKLVSQDVKETSIDDSMGIFDIDVNNYNVEILNIVAIGVELTIPSSINIYNKSSTYVLHIHNTVGGTVTLSTDFITEPNNPPITTTIGGYAQVWITYHKRSDNTEYWTANTINFFIMADYTSEFYYDSTKKQTVRFVITGEYDFKPHTLKVCYIKETWSADRTALHFKEKKSYIEGKEKRQEWFERTLQYVIDNGMRTCGEMFTLSCMVAILGRENLTEEDKI